MLNLTQAQTYSKPLPAIGGQALAVEGLGVGPAFRSFCYCKPNGNIVYG